MRTLAFHGKPILSTMLKRINEDLVQFVGLICFKFFNIMRLDPGFLSLPVETGELDSSFNEAKLTVSNLVVVNDGDERGVKLCHDYINSRKQEGVLQNILSGTEKVCFVTVVYNAFYYLCKKAIQNPPGDKIVQLTTYCLHKVSEM